MLGLIPVAADQAMSLYADTPVAVRTARASSWDATMMLAEVYGKQLVRKGESRGVEKLLFSTTERLRQRVVARICWEFAAAGKLDEGLRFADAHRPPPWKSNSESDVPYSDRDDCVATLANGAWRLDLKSRLDWWVTNATKVPTEVRRAAERTAPVITDRSIPVQGVGARFGTTEGHAIRLVPGVTDLQNLIKPDTWRSGPERGVDLFVLMSLDSDDELIAFADGVAPCRLTSLVDSTGQSLLDFPDSDGLVEIPTPSGPRWEFYEGVASVRGDGRTLAFQPVGSSAPSEQATFVRATGTMAVQIARTCATTRTAAAPLRGGSIYRSDDLSLKVTRLEPSRMALFVRSPLEYQDFLAEFPTQMVVQLTSAADSGGHRKMAFGLCTAVPPKPPRLRRLLWLSGRRPHVFPEALWPHLRPPEAERQNTIQRIHHTAGTQRPGSCRNRVHDGRALTRGGPFCGAGRRRGQAVFSLSVLQRATHAARGQRGRPRAVCTEKRRTYAAMVYAVDRGVGRLVEALNKTDTRDNTLIVFLSDNGGKIGGGSSNGPLRQGKGSVCEGGFRVPMFFCWPGHVPAGQRFSHPVTALDFYPTFARPAGAVPTQKLDGKDIWDSLQNGTSPRPQESIFALRHWNGFHNVGIRQDQWKAMKRGPRGPWELFDLQTDIGEQHDVSQAHPQLLASMVRQGKQWSQAHTQPRWFITAESEDAWQEKRMPVYDATFHLPTDAAGNTAKPPTGTPPE